MSNALLGARDCRHKKIQQLLKKNASVILIKANIPDKNKNINEAHFLVRFFSIVLQKQIELDTEVTCVSADGPYLLASTNESDSLTIKTLCMRIENDHPIGRFIDIDVFNKAEQSLSRLALNKEKRKCYLCNKDAFFCSRNKTHSSKDLISHIKNSISTYLETTISFFMKKSLMLELDLDHKFGLVTKTSNGSHQDMDYALMIKAQGVITPLLTSLFLVGYNSNSLETLLEEARPIGIEAEKMMFKKTGGINCYKGLIFVLGITILSVGYTLSHNEGFDDIFRNVKRISHSLYNEFEQEETSFGLNAYKRYQIRGVRGEVRHGLLSIRTALQTYEGNSDIELRKALKSLVVSCEDTVLLKRAESIDFYYEIKKQISNLDVANIDVVKRYTKFAISKNLSFGGSADLLIVTIFLNFIKSYFYQAATKTP